MADDLLPKKVVAPPKAKKEKRKKTPEELEAERFELASKVAANTLDDTKTRVAWLLNFFPEARDDDLVLTQMYWKTFDKPELAYADGLAFGDMRYLTRQTTIVRERARIQNQYKLYRASEDIRKRRAELAEEAVDRERDEYEQGGHDARVVNIYADESKPSNAAQHYVVGSVWIYDPFQMMQLIQKLTTARNDAGVKRELHFTELGRQDVPGALKYLEAAVSSSSMMAFKAVVVRRSDTAARPPDEVVYRLHEQLLFLGVEHELRQKRITLPRAFAVTKDADGGADKLRLLETRQKLAADLPARFGTSARLVAFNAEDSSNSLLIQLADLITGAITRVLNAVDGPKNHKDEFAARALELLGIPAQALDNGGVQQDFVTILRID